MSNHNNESSELDRPELAGNRIGKYQSLLRSRDYFMRKLVMSHVQEQLVNLAREGRVLVDVGCGEQPFRHLAEELRCKYIGVDISQNGAHNVDVIGPVTAMPLPDQVADLVICTEVLEHVSDTYGAFSELQRILKCGGFLILTVPFAYRLHEQPYDFVRLTPHQISACAERCGLEICVLKRGGNELQSLASSLDQFLIDVNFGGRGRLGQALRMASRLGYNGLALLGTACFGNRLPALQYLSNLAVLRRP